MPIWFGFGGRGHVPIRSIHAGDLLDALKTQRLLGLALSQGYNIFFQPQPFFIEPVGNLTGLATAAECAQISSN